jgi:two-component sensor histidine kinase
VLISPAASDGGAAFDWREIDGPPVPAVIKPGFGARLLQQVLRPQGGEVTFAFEPEGFRANVRFPAVM